MNKYEQSVSLNWIFNVGNFKALFDNGIIYEEEFNKKNSNY